MPETGPGNMALESLATKWARQHQAAWQRRLSDVMTAAMESLDQTLRRSPVDWSGVLRSAFDVTVQLGKIGPALNESIRRVHQDLADRGWVCDLDVPIGVLSDAERCLAAQDEAGVTEVMSEYVRRRSERFVTETATLFPARARVIHAAAGAHDLGQYDLSVPVFLSQTDGIAGEVFKGELFRRYGAAGSRRTLASRHGQALLTELSESGVAFAAMLGAMETGSSIAQDTNTRDSERLSNPYYGPLNRHAVIHGSDTEYGTEANSLRALLLLAYASDVARRVLRVPKAVDKRRFKESPPPNAGSL